MQSAIGWTLTLSAPSLPAAHESWEAVMHAVALRFYVHQPRRHGKYLLFEWLLEAKKLGIHGGSAFFATAGYGRHGVIHEQRFFELAEQLPVMVEFIVPAAEADAMLDRVRAERIHCFCTRTQTEVILVDDA